MHTLSLFVYTMIDLIYSRQFFTQRRTIVPNLFELQVTLLHCTRARYVLQGIGHLDENVPTVFAVNEEFLFRH